MSSGIHYIDKIRSSMQTSRWQTNLPNVSKWFRTTLSKEDKSEEKPSDYTANDRVNTDLPKLPVPDLQHTLTRYLEALQPILPEKQFERTKRMVDEFGVQGGDGERIQRGLEKRQEDRHNWAYDWWLDDMYLNNPIALPINSNPGMVFPPRKFTSSREMTKFAARLVSSALLFKQRIEGDDLPVETVVTNGVSQPLCMAQYDRIFTTYRVPGVFKDKQRRIGIDYQGQDPHITVICREQLYVVPLYRGNKELMSEAEIGSYLFNIVSGEKKRGDDGGAHYPIGLMTGMKRDWWASVREQLMKDPDNFVNFLLIETSMMIVCFDMETLSPTFNSKSKCGGKGFQIPSRDETNMMHQMIHGGGSVVNSGNRWFDKTIQLIISKDGVNGLCYEHSAAEGVAVINAVESMLKACDNLDDMIDPVLLNEDLKPLTWNATPDLDREICFARETVDRSVQDLDFKVFRFNEYGKNFIKSCRCSPDAFVQLALQLAYYKLHGALCATYESASTRRFRLGRVDCIRAETMEVLRWVSSMESSASEMPDVKISLEKKLELFDAALQKQTLITMENITGHGIDIHLLGLREMAKDYKMYAEIFEDETYALANQFLLSTSQVATKIDGFMGYGPVVPNGYGASYNPKDDSIIFCISSFQSSPLTSTAEFTQSLNESLIAMKVLVENRK